MQSLGKLIVLWIGVLQCEVAVQTRTTLVHKAVRRANKVATLLVKKVANIQVKKVATVPLTKVTIVSVTKMATVRVNTVATLLLCSRERRGCSRARRGCNRARRGCSRARRGCSRARRVRRMGRRVCSRAKMARKTERRVCSMERKVWRITTWPMRCWFGSPLCSEYVVGGLPTDHRLLVCRVPVPHPVPSSVQ
jgi:hypothetical protein